MPDLTVSNAITDATRITGVDGDGRSPTGGTVGIWQSATNLCTNGGIETNTTGWVASGALTIARSTEQAKFGSASLKSTANATDATLSLALGQWGPVTITAVQHTISAWIYITPGWAGGTIKVKAFQFTSATGTVEASANMALTGQWQRVVCGPFTPAGGDLTGDIRITADGVVQGNSAYIDGVQLEARRMATPYVQTNGSTASRASTRVTGPSSALDATRCWVAACVRPGWAYNAWEGYSDGYPRIMDYGVDGDNGFHLFYDTTTASPNINRWCFKCESGGPQDEVHHSVASTHAAGDPIVVIATITSAALRIKVNGSNFRSLARTRPVPNLSATTTFDIGRKSWVDDNQLNGEVVWFACGLGDLTDADGATLAAFGTTPPTLKQLPGEPTMAWPAITSSFQQGLPLPWISGNGQRGNFWRYK